MACCLASDGNRCVVGTIPMNPTSLWYTPNPLRSGEHNQNHEMDLLIFDLRMLTKDLQRTSIVAALENKRASGLFSASGGLAGGVASRWKAGSQRKSDANASQLAVRSGVVDMCLVEEYGEVMAMC